ncbi:hypothetical protein LZ518_06895 [Sphingomonas sp. RB56-2]|uniref:Uncharacterized protein n=1 Tax=Sphingomonas brevis TaxID=2908206 RepID=A0ABT0S9V9_9SPHN|nr:hypothetical protein [Sphingomonas brevis]MCL6740856.1 hypothetical protein [Sphingomonas brevis]
MAPRSAEAIDPRVPIPSDAPPGAVDAALVAQLAELVRQAQAGTSQFNARQAEADRLAAAAGPMASESWIAAQQALSRLIEQYGVTTQVAANIDAISAGQLERQHWIGPADQQAIASAAGEVAAISDEQSGAIDRLKAQLER